MSEPSGFTDPDEPADTAPGSRPGESREPHGAAGSDSDDDAVWAELVAAYHSEPTDPVGRWPAAEDIEPARDTEPAADEDVTDELDVLDDLDSTGEVALLDDRDADEKDDEADEDEAGPSQEAGATKRGQDPSGADDPDDHFIPPPAEPLRWPEPRAMLGWLGIVAGPVLLVIYLVSQWRPPVWLIIASVLGFGAGMVVLVSQPRSTPGDGEDGGAVV